MRPFRAAAQQQAAEEQAQYVQAMLEAVAGFRAQGHAPDAAEALAATQVRGKFPYSVFSAEVRALQMVSNMVLDAKRAEHERAIEAGVFGRCSGCDSYEAASLGVILPHFVGDHTGDVWECRGSGSPAAAPDADSLANHVRSFHEGRFGYDGIRTSCPHSVW